MLRFLGLLLAVWLVIVLIGAVVKGLFWLAVVGVVLFLGTSILGLRNRNSRSIER